MIITEGLAIDDPVSIQASIIPNFYDPAALAAWQQIARDVANGRRGVRAATVAHRRGTLQI